VGGGDGGDNGDAGADGEHGALPAGYKLIVHIE
jgi:hypothetical protein